MTKIEMNKQYQTRDGRAVRLLCVDGPGDFPVVGIINPEGDEHIINCWTWEGAARVIARADLVPVPEYRVQDDTYQYRILFGPNDLVVAEFDRLNHPNAAAAVEAECARLNGGECDE